MLEGVERLIDLTGFQASPDVTPARERVLSAILAGDTAALVATGGQFAGAARDGQTVRLARTIGVPLRYFVAKMYHGPFLVVSDRIDTMFEWCERQRIGWQFDPAYTRMIPAHYLVELDQVGCPDPMPRYRRFFEPSIGQGPADAEETGAAYVRAASTALTAWMVIVRVLATSCGGGAGSGRRVIAPAPRVSEPTTIMVATASVNLIGSMDWSTPFARVTAAIGTVPIAA